MPWTLQRAVAAIRGSWLLLRRNRSGSFTGIRDRHHREDGRSPHPQRHSAARHFRKKNLLNKGFLAATRRMTHLLQESSHLFRSGNAAPRGEHADASASGRGVLFIGPSESGLLLRHDFAQRTSGIAFRKSSGSACATSSNRAPSQKSAGTPTRGRPTHKVAHAHARAKETRPSSKIAHPAAKAALPLLDAAAELADEGRLSEAAQLCDEHLREHGSSAQAYYLLGLVRDTASRAGRSAEVLPQGSLPGPGA